MEKQKIRMNSVMLDWNWWYQYAMDTQMQALSNETSWEQ